MSEFTTFLASSSLFVLPNVKITMLQITLKLYFNCVIIHFVTLGDPSSFDFDLTLLICLLRHLEQKVPISDTLPFATDTSIAASLSRLKYYRNQVAHNQTLTLSCTEFEIWWNDITNVSYKIKAGITQ